MRIAEYKQISTETVENTILIPDEYDDNGNIVIPAHEEVITKAIPVMGMVYRDMTAEEVAEAERAQVDIYAQVKAEADSTIDNLMQAFAKATPAKVQQFKTYFDGLKMVYDADNPEPYIEGVTIPQNNAYYLINGVRHVYMDGQFVEF